MPFHPILLKGHSRPLTKVKYNREGDLLFTCAKDQKPCVWYADNGERLGTYNGHEGAVYDCDVNFTSTRLLTGSADQTARLWDVETGKQLFVFKHASSVRSVAFSAGDHMCLTVQDQQYNSIPTIFVHNVAQDVSEQEDSPVRTMFVDNAARESSKINQAEWGNMNETIVSCGDDGFVRVWDTETGKQVQSAQHHSKAIQSFGFSKDRTMLVTASQDQTACLYDVKSLQLLKTYKSDRPLNAGAISPIYNHVILGGGQEAKDVTTTAGRAGHFEIDFHHLVYQDFMGNVKGHFGPVNSLAFAPDGNSFASGAEDGYIRLHHFDKAYHSNKHNKFDS